MREYLSDQGIVQDSEEKKISALKLTTDNIVNLLITNGDDINQKDEFHRTSLHLAAAHRSMN